jgi:hypothetical protein
MATLDHLPSAHRRMTSILEEAGLPEPDEVNYHEEDAELELLWHEPKLAVIIECEPNCPVEPDDEADPELDIPL